MNKKQVLQEQIRNLIEQRQKMDSQVNEINMAKEEIDLLEPESIIYKLIGPLMIKQDLVEVKQNVDARLKFLNERIQYYDKEIEEVRTKNS